MLSINGKISIVKVFWFPCTLILWPLVLRNYMLRERGALPDKWYWADELMLKMGYAVKW